MILRQKPKNPQSYYITDSTTSQELHKNDFYPKYFYDKEFYFKKNKRLLIYLKGGETNK